MLNTKWWRGAAPVFSLLALLAATPRGTVFAQILLDGEWAPQYHEDEPERIPGPELVD